MSRVCASRLRLTRQSCKGNRLFCTTKQVEFIRQSSESTPARKNGDKLKRSGSHPQEIWTLLSEIFISTGNTAHTLSRYYRRLNLEDRFGKSKEHPSKNNTLPAINPDIQGDPFQFPRHTASDSTTRVKNTPEISLPSNATSALFWPCGTLPFLKSDFLRLMPQPSAEITSQNYLGERPDFQLVRNRNPDTLEPWIGYYLVFASPEEATRYYLETQDAELCGMKVNFSFVNPSEILHPPVLDKIPNVSMDMCALIIGLPSDITKTDIIRALRDYSLLDDEEKALVPIPYDGIGSSWLLRFKNCLEPKRLKRQYNERIGPLSPHTSTVEILTS